MKTKEYQDLTNGLFFKDLMTDKKNRKYLEDFLECYYNLPKGYLQNKLQVHTTETSNLIEIKFNDISVSLEMNDQIDNDYVRGILCINSKFANDDLIIMKTTEVTYTKDGDFGIMQNVLSDTFMDSQKNSDFAIIKNASRGIYENNRFQDYLLFINAMSTEERLDLVQNNSYLNDLFKNMEDVQEELLNEKLTIENMKLVIEFLESKLHDLKNSFD